MRDQIMYALQVAGNFRNDAAAEAYYGRKGERYSENTAAQRRKWKMDFAGRCESARHWLGVAHRLQPKLRPLP